MKVRIAVAPGVQPSDPDAFSAPASAFRTSAIRPAASPFDRSSWST